MMFLSLTSTKYCEIHVTDIVCYVVALLSTFDFWCYQHC